MKRELLIDANLLCLLVVGVAKPDINHPRLKAFGQNDLATVGKIVDRFDGLVLCPQVLAETANLIVYKQAESVAVQLRGALAWLVEKYAEHYAASKQVVLDPDYLRLGLTDAVLLLLAANGRTLLSDDIALCLAAQRRDLRTINYNYIRTGALTIDQIV